MKTLSVWIFIFLLSLALPILAQDIVVSKMEICTTIENREPVDTDSVFNSNVGQLYCFTKLTSTQDTSSISHVWLHGDKEMAKVGLTMKAKAWRTWSSKKIIPAWTGQWRVQVQKADGTVVSEKSFTIK
jgi:hypothetical protein